MTEETRRDRSPRPAGQPKTESHDPAVPEAYSRFMRQGWGDRELDLPRHPIADPAAARRTRLAEMFPGERLVLPAGGYKVRSYDTDYRFRPDTAHTYYCGNQTSDAVLVIDDGEPVLYARPRSGPRHRRVLPRPAVRRAVGRPPTLAAARSRRHWDWRSATSTTSRGRSVPPARPGCTAASLPRSTGWSRADETLDGDFERVVSEQRLIKDEWEVGELQEACDITALGFERLRAGVGPGDRARRALARGHVLPPGPRPWATTSATTRSSPAARTPPRCTGSTTPARSRPVSWCCSTWASRAATSTPPTSPARSRSTARYSPLQRELYDVVLAAQEAGIEAVRPGVPFTAAHTAAMTVLAHALDDMGLLPVSAEEALDPESKVYSRWTLHGTSHMLGLDVHDCGKAAPEAYAKGTLAAGMVLTVEPGLYFQQDDLLVPEELRGIGIRIEDDILVTDDGARNLSASLPRTAADVEAWMSATRE